MLGASMAELTQMSSVIGASSVSEIGSGVTSSAVSSEAGGDDEGIESVISEIEEIFDDEEETLVSEIDLIRMENQVNECDDENVKRALQATMAIQKAEIESNTTQA